MSMADANWNHTWNRLPKPPRAAAIGFSFHPIEITEIEQIGGEHSEIFKPGVLGFFHNNDVGPTYTLSSIRVDILDSNGYRTKGPQCWGWTVEKVHRQTKVPYPDIGEFNTLYLAQNGRNTLIYKDAEFYGVIAIKNRKKQKFAIVAKLDLPQETIEWLFALMDDGIAACKESRLPKPASYHRPVSMSDLTYEPSGKASRTCEGKLGLLKGWQEVDGNTIFTVKPPNQEQLADPCSDFIVLFAQNRCDLFVVYNDIYYRVHEYTVDTPRGTALSPEDNVKTVKFRCRPYPLDAKQKKWIAKHVSKSL